MPKYNTKLASFITRKDFVSASQSKHKSSYYIHWYLSQPISYHNNSQHFTNKEEQDELRSGNRNLPHLPDRKSMRTLNQPHKLINDLHQYIELYDTIL